MRISSPRLFSMGHGSDAEAGQKMISVCVRTALWALLFSIFLSSVGLAQTQPSPAIQEFPVMMLENVSAGKTPVGTKVQAKLGVATLVKGTVIPKNAVFSGQVIESIARSKTEPSRLAICMSSVTWKEGSATFKSCLTALYYPTMDESGKNLQYAPDKPANRTWNGQGQYPDPNSKSYKPFPGSEDKSSSVPDTPTSTLSNHHVPMKDVEYASTADGGIALVCKHTNLSLDKLTVYVLAADTQTIK